MVDGEKSFHAQKNGIGQGGLVHVPRAAFGLQFIAEIAAREREGNRRHFDLSSWQGLLDPIENSFTRLACVRFAGSSHV